MRDKKKNDILERLIDEQLSALPMRKAPVTLIPRVMQKVRATQNHQPWYLCSWEDCSLAKKICLICISSFIFAGIYFLGYYLWSLFQTSAFYEFLDGVQSVAWVFYSLLQILSNNAVQLLTVSVKQPVFLCILILMVSGVMALIAISSFISKWINLSVKN